MPILLCASNLTAKNFGSGFAWGSFAGLTTGMIASNMNRYQQPCKPSLYVVHATKPHPDVVVVPQAPQPQIVYYPQPQQVNHATETRIITNEPKCEECEMETKQLELQILKEQNRKKELALRENVYVVPQPAQPQVVYYPEQAQVKQIKEKHIYKNEPKCEVEAKQLELQILKEKNRKKELALREKEVEIQLLQLKQAC